MANIKISELNELEQVDNDDLLVIVDTSANETKKVKARNVGTGGGGSDVVIISDTQPTSEDNKIWINTGEVQNLGSELHVGSEINSKVRTNILFSKNLFDKDNATITNAYFDSSTGALVSGGGSYVTENYTEVNANTTYNVGNVTLSRVVFYNSSKGVISVTTTSTSFTTPANTKYIRIQITTNTSDIIIQKGTTTITPTINVDGEDIYVKGQNDFYSTQEQVIGTWINGKPLYRKVISTGALPNNSSKGIQHNISNIGIVKEVSGYVTDGSAFRFINSPSANSSIGPIEGFADTTYIYLRDSANLSTFSGYAIIEYTKTTD